jgi:hypothetical protein
MYRIFVKLSTCQLFFVVFGKLIYAISMSNTLFRQKVWADGFFSILFAAKWRTFCGYYGLLVVLKCHCVIGDTSLQCRLAKNPSPSQIFSHLRQFFKILIHKSAHFYIYRTLDSIFLRRHQKHYCSFFNSAGEALLQTKKH